MAKDTQVILNKGGTKERTAEISKITVPDLWGVYITLLDADDIDRAKMVLECWHLAHSLKNHIEEHG